MRGRVQNVTCMGLLGDIRRYGTISFWLTLVCGAVFSLLDAPRADAALLYAVFVVTVACVATSLEVKGEAEALATLRKELSTRLFRFARVLPFLIVVLYLFMLW